MNKLYMGIVFLIFAFVLSGCSPSPSPEENIYQTMEETAVKEADFEKYQQPLTDLEKEEKALFDEMMDFGMKDFEKISELADQALVNLDKREEMMKEEKAVLDASQEEFKNTANRNRKN